MKEPGESPENVVVLLLDSLNRHMLGCYGGAEFATPNLDRFAADRATRFTRHVTGSLPCMPARHDILCGALDFLWKPWGSIEIWEEPVTAPLRSAGVTTMLVSDHPHLFEAGGENYHTDFFGWDYVRGHEGDPWKTHLDPSWVGAPTLPAVDGGWFWRKLLGEAGNHMGSHAYDRTRTFLRREEEFPGPRTMSTAAAWLRDATPHHDRWLLFVDEFDPHEPFDTPEPWLGRYEEEPWEDELIIWPPYTEGAQSRGQLTERQARHIRANYGAKLSMIDHWLGEVMNALDERDLWDSTAVIICTDHGHYLGDERGGHDIWGKPRVPQFEPLGHTPLLIHWPGLKGGRTNDALTTNVDLHATIADIFGVAVEQPTHGHSLVPLLKGAETSIREWALGGIFGNWVQVTDGRWKYARAPEGDGFPLAMWSNRWSTMPVRGLPPLPRPDKRAELKYMPGSTVPVIRQPFENTDTLPFWASSPQIVDRHHLYDIANDPDEQENRRDEAQAKQMIDLLRAALETVDAPREQFERLGIS